MPVVLNKSAGDFRLWGIVALWTIGQRSSAMAYFVIESRKSVPNILPFLIEEGFVNGCPTRIGNNTPWTFVDIDKKVYVFGVYGAAAAGPVIGDTHLTADEFKTIYDIIKRSRQRMKDIPHWKDRVALAE